MSIQKSKSTKFGEFTAGVVILLLAVIVGSVTVGVIAKPVIYFFKFGYNLINL